jgi:hypothetical protein
MPLNHYPSSGDCNHPNRLCIISQSVAATICRNLAPPQSHNRSSMGSLVTPPAKVRGVESEHCKSDVAELLQDLAANGLRIDAAL